ncbi:MAG: hypothetical protein EHM28_03760 [Spirochaetaceae bacterium]|nr:MAG: hypothetical protein EHM28_03760 [Spirochaetaceae bacterium]
MTNLLHEVEVLNRRETFNKVVNHAKTVTEIVDSLEGNYNLADVLNNLMAEGRLEGGQISPILSSILVDKYHYSVKSTNLSVNITEFETIAGEISKWKAVDVVFVYFHPELGITIINPKRLESLKAVQNMKKNELVNVYVGAAKGTVSGEIKELALGRCLGLLDLEKPKASPSLVRGSLTVKEVRVAKKVAVVQKPRREKAAPARGKGKKAAAGKAAPAAIKSKAQGAPAATGGSSRMTPFYSIPVTNELFHNGNVEAWKKIIESYTTKYPGLEVYIFYEGERIHDINTLFKWGKVKHGCAILIAVAGSDIKDVAKLQRYLKQGASHLFESFLKFPVNHILNLF